MNVTPTLTHQSAAFLRATVAGLIAKYPEAVGQHVIDALRALDAGMQSARQNDTDLARVYREHATHEHHYDGDLEFDREAVVSLSEGRGAYVQCWKWVSNAEPGLRIRATVANVLDALIDADEDN